jgi:2-methyl-3-hydroxypyridine 5-carboxylic acid dioxygenase
MTQKHAEIAGGGFAGLTAAISLRQQGWSVTVHEQAEELRAIGAGIFLWENGLRVLEQVGAYDEVMADSVTPPFYETRIHDTTASKENFAGRRWRTMARSRLHGALVNSAVRHGVEIRTNSAVVSAEPQGVLKLASGERRTADFILGADGVSSRVRESIGFSVTTESSRDGISRVLVPRDPEHKGGDWDNVIDMWNFAPRTIRILYVPCNDDLLYLGLMAPNEDTEAARTPIDLDVWVKAFPHMEPALRRVAELKNPRRDTYQTNVLDRWTEGNVAVVGDAAHAMCPALAQGAGTGMMNAYALGAILGQSTMPVADALRAWELQVRPYTDRCQSRSGWFAETRSMSRGYQFTYDVMETANVDPLELARVRIPTA